MSVSVAAMSAEETRVFASSSTTCLPDHDSSRRVPASAPISFVANHGNGVFDRLKIAMDDPFVYGRADISSMVLHEPSRSKKRDRHRELPERLLHHVTAIEQIRPGDVGTNRRKSNDSLCLRLLERYGKTVDLAFSFRKSRRGIE
jgi:hypothetical protein